MEVYKAPLKQRLLPFWRCAIVRLSIWPGVRVRFVRYRTATVAGLHLTATNVKAAGLPRWLFCV